jgi:hypothetical protein
VIVDFLGVSVIDNFVRPTLPVSNYRTNVTGIEPQDLLSGERGILIFPDRTFQAVALTRDALMPSTFRRRRCSLS